MHMNTYSESCPIIPLVCPGIAIGAMLGNEVGIPVSGAALGGYIGAMVFILDANRDHSK